MAAPRVVIDGRNPDAQRHRRRALDAAVAAGLAVREDWVGRPGVVCTGTIASDGDARLVLLAALDGAGLIVLADAQTGIVDGLIDDLRRLGPVDHLTADIPAPPSLDGDERALLALLAEGLTLGAAASALGMPRRTADRRLASARASLGAVRTADALVRARRLGLLGSRPNADPR